MSTVLQSKENKKNLKRKRIIDSASQLFSRKSYHEVMMEDVAKLSSVAKGTVYTYFSSKEELYFSIMKLRMEKLITSLKEKTESEENSVKSLHSFVIHLYMFMMKYRNFFLMYRKESLNADNDLCSEILLMEKDYRSLLCSIIRSGKNQFLFRDIDEDFAVELVLGSIYGAVQRGIENNLDENQQMAERDKIFEFVLKGIVKDLNNKVLPLKGKTIVLTRSADIVRDSEESFKKLGAEVISFPVLEIVPPDSWEEFDKILNAAEKIDYLVFTSANAVKMFVKRTAELSTKINYKDLEVIAVGTRTADECRRNNIPVGIIPEEFSSHGILKELSSYPLKGKIFFIPRSAIGRDELPDGLKSLGAAVRTAPVYNVEIPSDEVFKPAAVKLESNNPDLFIFTSPSAFENFISILKIDDPKLYFNNYAVAVIGPATKEAVDKRDVSVHIMPSEYTLDGLAEAVVKFYAHDQKL